MAPELPGMPALKGLVRSVRTPEFADVTFHEVRAKSVLNRVPGASPMPFSWTVNPYRGCSHACTYCLAADTPILRGDGRAVPLSEIRAGDVVYGTQKRGRYRHYVRTTVRDVWTTRKPAWRITLADGTTLVASAEHRFLTERGWKHVAAEGCAGSVRPHLTTNNALLGLGALTAGPKHDERYRRGYLTGMVRGDAHLGSYRYERPGRAPGDVHRFRLALADREALDRSRDFLDQAGLPTTTFGFAPSTPARRPITAIRASSRAVVDGVRALVAWPEVADDQWSLGFLAGIFDAEGSCSRGVLRFSNGDETILREITAALERHGFRSVVERPQSGVPMVRLLGGLGERTRFLQRVDPSITRKRDFEGTALKNPVDLRVRSVEPLGLTVGMIDLTTDTGDFIANGVVSHNCFARNTHTYLDLDAGDDFDRQVVVKLNAPEVLARELRSPRWAREHVAMGTNTDPYQRAEGRYRLMPGIISALARSGTPLSILTKGTLLTRDLPELVAAARDVPVGIGVSLALLDPDLHRSVEPGTPTPRARLDLVRRITDAGLPCGVFVAPVLPGLTDSDAALDALLGEIAAAGATGASVLALHLRPGTREWFHGWLGRAHPELLERYAGLYRGGAYVQAAYRRDLAAGVGPLLRRHGLDTGGHRLCADEREGRVGPGTWPAGATPPRPAPPPPVVPEGVVTAEPEQLTLL